MPRNFHRPKHSRPLQIEVCPLDDLHPDPLNPRLHSKRQLKQLALNIRSFGFLIPVLVDASGTLIAGHGRVEAARLAGLTKVPALRIEHLSPEQIRAFQIADNRLSELSTWDEPLLGKHLKTLTKLDLSFDIEATGFSMGEIDFRLEHLSSDTPPETPPDAADEFTPASGPAVSQLGDLWQLGEHRVLCGNALESATYDALLGCKRAGVVFTDPPYNVPIQGHVGGKGKIKHREFAMACGEMNEAEFTGFLTTALGHLAHYSRDGAIHYVCMDWAHAAMLHTAGRTAYTELKNLCVWCKHQAGMGSLYRSQHELVFVFKSGTAPHINNVELGRHGRHRSNVWNYPGILAQRTGEEGDLLRLHPTLKPVRLIADALLDCSRRGDIVLDAFLGSGSTLIAAQRVGRVCYGIELDPLYVDTAIRRWQTDTGQDAVLVSSGQTFTQTSQAQQAPVRGRRARRD